MRRRSLYESHEYVLFVPCLAGSSILFFRKTRHRLCYKVATYLPWKLALPLPRVMLIICLRFNVFTNLEEKVAQLRGIEDTNLTKIPLLNLAISYNQHVVEFAIHRILMN